MSNRRRRLHHAFRIEWPGLKVELTTPCFVTPHLLPGEISEDFPVGEFLFVWDTGATGSVITSDVVQSLGLVPTGIVTVQGVNSIVDVPTYLVDIVLPNNLRVSSVVVTECDIGSAGADKVHGLIGMDIILMGDMSISNGEGKTLFTFAYPSFENKTDLYEKAKILMPKKGVKFREEKLQPF